jgi:predicted metal-binding membrane protein
MAGSIRLSGTALSGLLIATGLSAATAAAWWALYTQQVAMTTQPMDRMWMPPTGTWRWSPMDFGLTWSMWAIMMLAMMLPVVTPMALLIHRLGQERRTDARVSLPGFLSGYFLLWTGFSVAATLLQWLFHGLSWLTPMMDAGNAAVSGAILALAGVYQFTPWKAACLNHCRTPMGFLLGHWRPGWRGGLRLGLHHGRYCLGCCWAEMLVMFAVGVMNVLWMGAITLAIVAERYLPGSADYVRRLTGIGLLAFGLARWL